MVYDRKRSCEFDWVKQDYKNISKHPLYNTWYMMNVRCYDDRHKAYHRYGGRGISVCKSWRWDNENAFSNFIRSVGERPEGKTLDRINGNSGYCSENVCWSDKRTQSNNIKTDQEFLGVIFIESKACFLAQINLFGTTFSLGYFSCKEGAKSVYSNVKDVKMSSGDAAAKSFYSKNYKNNTTRRGEKLSRNKSSRYEGVSYVKKSGLWRAYTTEVIEGKHKQVNLGHYKEEDDTYKAYLKYMEER